MKIKIIFILHLNFIFVLAFTQTEKDIVYTKYGPVMGYTNTTSKGCEIRYFKGIPIAKQPVGDLRFKPLEEPDPWKEIKNSTEHGPICMQPEKNLALFAPGSEISEACIFVNVYTPAHADSSSQLPVIVHIHASSGHYGSGNSYIYGPGFIVPNDIILVTMNHRLGALGFLSLDTPDFSSNLGFKDIVYALQWTKKNINAFGGDPEKITLGGHGFGGVAASLIQYSPMVEKGLFKRVFSISGDALSPVANTSPLRAKDLAMNFASKLGIQSTDPKVILKKISKLDAATIQAAADETFNEEASDLVAFGSAIEKDNCDGKPFLTEEIKASIESGKVNDVPTLKVFTRDEGIFYARLAADNDLMEELNKNQIRLLPQTYRYSNISASEKKEIVKQLKSRYFGDKKICNETLLNWMNLISDIHYKYPMLKIASMYSNISKSPVFIAQYQFVGETTSFSNYSDNNQFTGAGHSYDISYIFESASQPAWEKGSRDQIFSEEITRLLTNFAKYGNPTPQSKGKSYWPEFKAEDPKLYVLDENQTSITNPYPELIEFYDKINKIIEGE